MLHRVSEIRYGPQCGVVDEPIARTTSGHRGTIFDKTERRSWPAVWYISLGLHLLGSDSLRCCRLHHDPARTRAIEWRG